MLNICSAAVPLYGILAALGTPRDLLVRRLFGGASIR